VVQLHFPNNKLDIQALSDTGASDSACSESIITRLLPQYNRKLYDFRFTKAKTLTSAAAPAPTPTASQETQQSEDEGENDIYHSSYVTNEPQPSQNRVKPPHQMVNDDNDQTNLPPSRSESIPRPANEQPGMSTHNCSHTKCKLSPEQLALEQRKCTKLLDLYNFLKFGHEPPSAARKQFVLKREQNHCLIGKGDLLVRGSFIVKEIQNNCAKLKHLTEHKILPNPINISQLKFPKYHPFNMQD
jgi:hypothetical protein